MVKSAFNLNSTNGNISTLFRSPKTKIGCLVDDLQRKLNQSSSIRQEVVKRQSSTKRFTDFMSELEDSKNDINNNPQRFINNVNMLMYALT